MKPCLKCGISTPPEGFHAGSPNVCKVCKRAAAAAWRRDNPDRVAQQRANPAYRYKRTASESDKTRVRAWQLAHPERMRDSRRRYKDRNPDSVRLHVNRRRARLAGAAGAHTIRDWLRVLSAYNHLCAWCGSSAALTRDHVIPLSRGGSDYIGNIVPACNRCNASKRDRLVVEWRYGAIRRIPSTQ